MNSSQFARWLKKQGIEIIDKPGHGHKVLRNPKTGALSEIPVHGGSKQLKTGLMRAIKKQLGLE